MNGFTRCSANVEDRETQPIFGPEIGVLRKSRNALSKASAGDDLPALMRAKAPRAGRENFMAIEVN